MLRHEHLIKKKAAADKDRDFQPLSTKLNNLLYAITLIDLSFTPKLMLYDSCNNYIFKAETV